MVAQFVEVFGELMEGAAQSFSPGSPVEALTSLSMMEVGLGLSTIGVKGVSGSVRIFLMAVESNPGE